MSRNTKPRLQVRNRFVLVFDLALISLSALGSYALRLEMGPDFFRYYLSGALWLMGVSLLVKPLVFYLFGLYRRLWVYASINELKVIALAVTTASGIVSIIMIGLFMLKIFGPGLPRSVLAIDWLLSLFGIGGIRFTIRLLAESGIPIHEADRIAPPLNAALGWGAAVRLERARPVQILDASGGGLINLHTAERIPANLLAQAGRPPRYPSVDAE